jgi:hypothetical protein
LTRSEIAFGSETDEITSSTAFTYDNTSATLNVGTLSITGDATQTIIGYEPDADINISPNGAGRFVVTGTGSALITTDPGEELAIVGDSGLSLNTNTGVVTVNVGTGASTIAAGIQQILTLESDTGISINGEYLLPMADGSLGQAIVTDGAGNLTFSTIAAGGTVALPETQIAYGSATDTVTSSAALTFDASNDTLQVGALAGAAQIESNDGQSMTVKGSTNLILQSLTGRVTIVTGADNYYDMPAFDGSAGQAIVTDGAGNLTFSTIAGAGAVDSVFGRAGAVVADASDYAAFYATLANLNLKANINSPTFTGIVQAPTAPINTAGDTVATTGYTIAQAAATVSDHNTDTNAHAGIFVQPGDNITELTNNAGFITLAQVPAAPVTSFNTRTGAIVPVDTDYAAFYATTAQGAKADSALQSGNNITELTNNANYITLAEIPANPSTLASRVVYDNTGTGLAATNVQTAISELDTLIDSNTALAHSHVNKSVLDGITSAGSGQIITIAERATLGSALQPADNISELTNDAGYITLAQVPVNPATTAAMVAYDNATTGLPTNVQDAIDTLSAEANVVQVVFGRTGAIAAEETDYNAFYATVAQGAKADTALQPSSPIGALADVSVSMPINGQLLLWNDTDWVNASPIEVQPGQIAVGISGALGAGYSVAGSALLNFDNNTLKIGDTTTSGGTLIAGSPTETRITSNGNNADIILEPNGTGSVIVDNGQANGLISAAAGETLTIKSDGDLTLEIPVSNVVKVADVAQYDAALAVNTGDAFITKSYFDAHRNDALVTQQIDNALAQQIDMLLLRVTSLESLVAQQALLINQLSNKEGK